MSEQPHWRRWIVILVVVAVVAVGVGLTVLLDGSGTPAVTPSATPSASSKATPTPPLVRAQHNLLLEVRDDSRKVVFAQIMSTSYGKTPGKLLQVPTDLLVPTPTWSPLRLTGDANDTLQSQRALEQLLGVNIDISLILDRLAFAGLIDATLTPQEAVAARSSDDVAGVVSAALAKLPSSSEAAGQVLLSLGHMARSSSSNSDLVALLLTLRKDAIAGNQKRVTLPVSTVRANDAVVVKRSATDAMVGRHFAASLLAPGETVRPRVVLIPAGASAAQLALATENLIDAGMTVIPGETGNRVANSRVTVPPDLVSVRIGQRAATAIGLLAAEVKESAKAPVDVEIVLGPDVPSL